ncbi:MAG: transposase [Chitinophagaceae bacterium]|nr:transposase [Chitinophagaceae bacterium]
MEAGKMYHIYNRGINKGKIFFTEANYYFFLQQFSKYLGNLLEVYSYCLLPNHFHLLIRINEVISFNEPSKLTKLQKSFRDFFISYSKAINKQENRCGALLQQKYKRKEINSDEYCTTMILYIHNNPVQAGLCNHPSEWKFSSYNSIAQNNPKTRICKDKVLSWFGGPDAFIKMHASPLA